MGRMVWLLAALVGGVLLAWQGTVTPAPLPADAPAGVFSAGRAMADIAVIAKAPHPIGSPQNQAVRDYLVGRMTALGLSPRVQTTQALLQDRFKGEAWVIGGTVQNIVGVIRGLNPSEPAVAIMAHYDSVPGSPGAADDATGVASALEVARILKSNGTPERDVVILLTDGEEAGLLGAHGFFEQDPLARRIGVVINMESRGGGGRANMFQTGPDNGNLIRLLAANARAPISSSLAVFLYEQMPNDTDFTVSKAAGITGLNFAFIGRQFDYHSPSSTLANLDPGSVQSMGDQVLAVAGPLAFEPVRRWAASPSLTYSQTWGDHVLAYAPGLGWLILLAAAILIVLAIRPGRKTGVAPLATLKAVGGGLYLIVATALMLHLMRRVTGVGFGFLEMRPLLAQWGVYEAALVMLTAGVALHAASALAHGVKVRFAVIAPLVGGLLCSLFGGWDLAGLVIGLAGAILSVSFLGKPPPLASAWLGSLVLAFLVALVMQVAAPTTAFLVAWPLLLAAFMAAVGALGSRSTPIIRFGEAVLIACGLGWLGVYLHSVAQGLDIPDLLALFGFLGMLLAWPLAHRAGRWPGPVLIAAGLLAILVVRFHSPWTERYPQVNQAAYVTDGKQAWRAALTPGLDSWTGRVVTADGGVPAQRGFPPLVGRKATAASARLVPVPGATFKLTGSPGGYGVTLTGPPGARMVGLDLQSSGALGDLRVNGLPVKPPQAGGALHIRWAATPQGLAVSFGPAAPHGDLTFVYGAQTPGWPAGAMPLPPRPAAMRPWDAGDSTIVFGTVKQPACHQWEGFACQN